MDPVAHKVDSKDFLVTCTNMFSICLNKFKFTLHSKRLELGSLEIPCMRNCLETESNFIWRNEAG